jgi:hypothetical protein
MFFGGGFGGGNSHSHRSQDSGGFGGGFPFESKNFLRKLFSIWEETHRELNKVQEALDLVGCQISEISTPGVSRILIVKHLSQGIIKEMETRKILLNSFSIKSKINKKIVKFGLFFKMN